MSVVILEYFLHIDTHLAALIASYGLLVYALLFLIVFCETGLVVAPFLPGDSLLFAAGTFASQGYLHLTSLFFIFLAAAVLGDAANYFLGARIGRKAFERNWRFLNQEHLKRTQAFYEREGGKTIVIARFLPVIRTFAPFVAGIGAMEYPRFFVFNVTGALLWVTLFLGAGYFFGNIPFVRDNFSVVILVIIGVSLLPGIVEWARQRLHRR